VCELFMAAGGGRPGGDHAPGGQSDPGHLVRGDRREGVRTLHTVPSLLQLFLEHPDAELPGAARA
jgi:hypothetical protein